MSKTFNCFYGTFSFASRVVRHPLTRKVALTIYRVLKKFTPILAVALLEVAFLLVEKSTECVGSFVIIMVEETKGGKSEPA